MNKKIKNNKTILITGCSRGIGYATVELLASKGYLIYAGVRSLYRSAKLKALAKIYPNIKIRKINLKETNSIKKIVMEFKTNKIKLDIIINNAGTIIFGPVESVSPQQLYDQFQVNLFGPILLTQEFLPMMRKQNAGHIIFLGSTSGVESHGMYGAYAASKFALEAICHSLAVNLHRWNIKVSIIELSATATLIAKNAIQIGSRLDKNTNPYLKYTSNTLAFLQELLINGELPTKIAKKIFDVIHSPKSMLRHFATKKAQNIFKHSVRDYFGTRWKEEAKEADYLFK